MTKKHLQRLRRICFMFPETAERLSHGEPTFFAGKRVFAMCSSNHHQDGHTAVLVPAPPGMQELLLRTSPAVYYRPPYVGGNGWIGIELDRISDKDLEGHIHDAWRMVAPKKLINRVDLNAEKQYIRHESRKKEP